MKTILASFVLLLSVTSYAQDWKEFGVLPNGDTIRVGDSIYIKRGVDLNDIERYVRPPIEDVVTTKIYIDAIKMYMEGKTYVIHQMSRWRVSKRPKKYIPIAKIIADYSHPMASDVEYRIFLDNAIKKDIIEIRKKK